MDASTGTPQPSNPSQTSGEPHKHRHHRRHHSRHGRHRHRHRHSSSRVKRHKRRLVHFLQKNKPWIIGIIAALIVLSIFIKRYLDSEHEAIQREYTVPEY